MKVAIVHDYLMQMGGAEKVVEVLHSMFPEAPIYTSAFDPKAMPPHFGDWKIHTTFLQRLPAKRKTHRAALLLYPTAFESLDLSRYDLVISSSSSFAKGIITQPHTVHVCYTYTPMRFAWTPRSYMKEERVSMLARSMLGPGLHYLRTWDALAAMRVDQHVAISRAVAERIHKFYRRASSIVYPPVETNRFHISPEVDDYYLMVARLAPYKRLDLAVEACTRLGRRLKIVGSGRYGKMLKKMAGPTVEFLGHVSDEELPMLFARAKAYIMPGEEDFGISPVEANAAGRPVIAYAAGGALDTQLDGVTGVLFEESTVESLIEAMYRADEIDFEPERIRKHACNFDTQRFIADMHRVINKAVAEHQNARAHRNRKEQPEPEQMFTAMDAQVNWEPEGMPSMDHGSLALAANGTHGHSNGFHGNGHPK